MTIKPVRPIYLPIGPSIAYVELTQGQWALIDSEDAETIGEYNWLAQYSPRTNSFYALRAAAPGLKPRTVRMHRVILRVRDGHLPDHKNSNTLDNRRSNLRRATSQQNSFNRRVPSDNTSGFKGVSWHAGDQVWQAKIRANRTDRYLGSFHSAEEAHAAYCAAAVENFGEFANMGGR